MIRFKRLFKSFRYAVKGLITVFREEQNLLIQSIVGVLIIFLGLYVGLSQMEWAVIVMMIGLVLLVEIINSAVERVSDVLKPRINSYVKEIKDVMAAAVMLASVIAVIVGLIVFVPHLFD